MEESNFWLKSLYSKNKNLFNILLLIIITFAIFSSCLSNYYLVADDFNNLLHDNRSFVKTFITNTVDGNIGGDYRPIEVISHQIDRYFYGDENPFGRYLTNIIVHILNVLLVYLLASFLTKNKTVGFLAALLFAVHFIHANSISQPVTWISGRVDLFLTFFYLLTFVLFTYFLSTGSKIAYITSLITFILTLLSKELAVTLPLIVVVFLLLFHNREENYNGDRIFKTLLWIFLCLGILLLFSGFIFNADFIASTISSDGKLSQSSIDRIQYGQIIIISAGFILIFSVLLIHLILKKSKKLGPIIINVKYSIPYFLVLVLYFIVRFIVLKGLGGHYISQEGTNIFLGIGPDTFVRDLLSVIGLFWPMGSEYNLSVLEFQVNSPTLFYLSGVFLFLILLFILYKIISTKSKILIFCFLWIFIILLPVHNAIIVPGGYQTRYFYLPLVGFCILVSILLYKLMHLEKQHARFSRIAIVVSVLIIVTMSSVLIIKNTLVLKNSSKITERFVKGLKENNFLITDNTNIYFITAPIHLVTVTDENIEPFRPAIMSKLALRTDYILNFCDKYEGYTKTYFFDFVLFLKCEEESNINVNWLDESKFILKRINLNECLVIPDFSKFSDKKLEKFPHIQLLDLESLASVGEVVETNNAFIKVLDIDSKTDLAELEVTFKVDKYKLSSKNIFFKYENNSLNLVENFPKNDNEHSVVQN